MLNDMFYSEWLYEYERCYDLYDCKGFRFYYLVMKCLEVLYPGYYDAWYGDNND